MKSVTLAAVVVSLGVAVQGQTQAPVYKAGDKGVQFPVVTKEKKPVYTAEAMRQKIQGNVVLETVIDTAGKPTEIKVVRSLDAVYGLDDKAVAALKEWEFKPALREGKAVPFRVTVEMTFTLRDQPVFDKSSTGVTRPVLVLEQKPSYTPETLRERIEGVVELEGIIQTNGKVADVRVVKGLDPRLDQKAIEAFKASTFKPAMLGTRPVLYRVGMEFRFTLRE